MFCNKIIIFRNFNLNKSFSPRSYISEVTVPLIINDVPLYALLDSGSESSILSLSYANKYFKNWQSYENGFYELDYGIGVDGSRFKILGTKRFKVQIGSTILSTYFSIPEKGTALIIGLDLLKLFNISMHFGDNNNIHIYCNDKYVKSENIKNNNENLSTNQQKCVIYPNETKIFALIDDKFIENRTYLSYSNEASSFDI